MKNWKNNVIETHTMMNVEFGFNSKKSKYENLIAIGQKIYDANKKKCTLAI